MLRRKCYWNKHSLILERTEQNRTFKVQFLLEREKHILFDLKCRTTFDMINVKMKMSPYLRHFYWIQNYSFIILHAEF